MALYTVLDHQNREFGTFTSHERAVSMLVELQYWFADRTFRIEELHYEPASA